MSLKGVLDDDDDDARGSNQKHTQRETPFIVVTRQPRQPRAGRSWSRVSRSRARASSRLTTLARQPVSRSRRNSTSSWQRPTRGYAICLSFLPQTQVSKVSRFPSLRFGKRWIRVLESLRRPRTRAFELSRSSLAPRLVSTTLSKFKTEFLKSIDCRRQMAICGDLGRVFAIPAWNHLLLKEESAFQTI